MPAIKRPRRRPRVAFVLSGGGNLGAIQVGQLRALAERDIVAELVLGCSVGALNGAAYAADPTLAGIRHLESLWRTTSTPDLMPSSRMPNPLQMVRKGTALYKNDGLRRGIARFLGGRTTFEELEIPFQCMATDMDLAMEHWFTSGPLMEPILASAALPSVYPPVTIDGRRYLDGGVVNNVPISRALELGVKRIYVLHVGLHGRPEAEIKRPIDAALMAYWIARNSGLARDLATLPKGVEVVVLPPGDRPDIRFDDFSQSPALVEQGHSGAAQHLDEIAAAEEDEPGLAERLRRDMFVSADWWRVLERRRRDREPVEADGATGDAADDGPDLDAEDQAELDRLAGESF